MAAVTWLHSILGPALAGALVVLTVSSGAGVVRGGAVPSWVDGLRRVVLALLVAEAALGLTLALRGAAPGEAIHWVYGAAVIALLLAPAALVERPGLPRRSVTLTVAAAAAALLAWRLWETG